MNKVDYGNTRRINQLLRATQKSVAVLKAVLVGLLRWSNRARVLGQFLATFLEMAIPNPHGMKLDVRGECLNPRDS